eukprot:XP_001710077.1 Hypothetical protein GL50803_91767 [Giardia lamblia ATCC 50803]
MQLLCSREMGQFWQFIRQNEGPVHRTVPCSASRHGAGGGPALPRRVPWARGLRGRPSDPCSARRAPGRDPQACGTERHTRLPRKDRQKGLSSINATLHVLVRGTSCSCTSSGTFRLRSEVDELCGR